MGYGSANSTLRAIDRKREMERRILLSEAHRRADELAVKLVTKLLDGHILETTSDKAVKEALADLLRNLSQMEEFDIQYKIAPVRAIVPNPNFISQYVTQFITEDLINNKHVQDIFGDDLEIYRTVDSVLAAIRPE